MGELSYHAELRFYSNGIINCIIRSDHSCISSWTTIFPSSLSLCICVVFITCIGAPLADVAEVFELDVVRHLDTPELLGNSFGYFDIDYNVGQDVDLASKLDLEP